MTDRKISTFIKIWKIAKGFYHYPEPHLLVVSLCLLVTTLLSIGLPYLLKLLVNQSQTNAQPLLFRDYFSVDLLYLLALAYALGWLLKQMKGFTCALVLRKFDSALIFEGLKNYFSLKHEVQKKQDAGVHNTNLLRGSEAFGQILYTVFFIIVPAILQIIGMVWVLSSNIYLSYGFYFLVFFLCTVLLSLMITFKTEDFLQPCMKLVIK